MLLYHTVFYKSAETKMLSSTASLLKQQTAELRSLLSSGLGMQPAAPAAEEATPAPADDEDDENDLDYDPEADEDVPNTWQDVDALAGFSLDANDNSDDEDDGSLEEEEEEEDLETLLAEEHKLEYMSERRLTKEDDDSWQHEVQPLLEYKTVGG